MSISEKVTAQRNAFVDGFVSAYTAQERVISLASMAAVRKAAAERYPLPTAEVEE